MSDLQTLKNKDELRRDRGPLVAELVRAGMDHPGRRENVKCPFHGDRSESATIRQTDGVWRFRCHSCSARGDVFDIKALVSGRRVEDVMKAEKVTGLTDQAQRYLRTEQSVARAQAKPKKVWKDDQEIRSFFGKDCGKVTIYRYNDPRNKALLALVVRVDKPDGTKEFKQFRAVPGGVVCENPGKPWPLYRAEDVGMATDVFVVEGEKACEALRSLGIAAVSAMGGAGKDKAQYTDWSPLEGRRVYLWPDWDPEQTDEDARKSSWPGVGKRKGVEYMREVAGEIGKLPNTRVFLVDPSGLPGMPDKGDAFDYVAFVRDAAGPTEPEESVRTIVLEVRKLAGEVREVDEVEQHFRDMAAGRFRDIEWTLPWLTELTLALLPGKITVIGGSPGAGKSLLVMDQILHWTFEAGVKVACLMLEDEVTDHVSRGVAQLAAAPWMLKPKQCVGRLEEVDRVLDETRAARRRLLQVVEVADAQFDYGKLLGWMRAKCEAGAQVLVVDPITAIDSGREPWIADAKFVMAAMHLIKQYGARLILVTHPRGGAGKAAGPGGVDDLAGGRAFGRFTHTVLNLRKLPDEGEEMYVKPYGKRGHNDVVQRTLSIWKARNGEGTGFDLAVQLRHDNLRFRELGLAREKDSDEARLAGLP